MSDKEYRQTPYAPPTGATQILLIRHGESRPATAADPFPLVDGHGDPELHANGRAQAQQVGERLRHTPIDALYVTKLRRTSETAAPLAAHLGLTPVLDTDLHEVNLGEWEGGIMRIKAAENHPIYAQMQTEQRWDVIPGAESWETLNTRLMRGLARLHERHPDQLIAAVVHGGVIGHILATATGARPFAFLGAANGSISHIVMHDGQINVRGFNDSAHLDVGLSASGPAMT